MMATSKFRTWREDAYTKTVLIFALIVLITVATFLALFGMYDMQRSCRADALCVSFFLVLEHAFDCALFAAIFSLIGCYTFRQR